MGRLDGKTIVVTGGAHGIGRAYCERFGHEGASVAVLDVDGPAAEQVADAIRQAGGQALAVQVDVSDWASVQAAARATLDRFGGVDGLVNNAALFATIPISRVRFEEIDEAEWDRVMDVNVKGPWLCCRAFVPAMRERGGGSIVNIASSTVFNGDPTRLHYVASKGAVFGMTRVLSRELGPDNIRVNTVAPGNTLSEENPTPEIVAMRESAIASRSIKRVERPEDVVGAVLFMLSDEAAFVSGQTLLVNGGFPLH